MSEPDYEDDNSPKVLSVDEKASIAEKRREDRQIVTPYAFEVADSLMGTPLAGNWHRGFALCIDLLFVAILADTSSVLLAGVLAWVFFRAGNRLREKKRFVWGRKIMRGLAALLLFIFAVGLFDEITRNSADYFTSGQTIEQGDDIARDGIDGVLLLGLSAQVLVDMAGVKKKIENNECPEPVECWLPFASGVGKKASVVRLKKHEVNSILTNLIEEVNLNQEQTAKLSEALWSEYKEPMIELTESSTDEAETAEEVVSVKEASDSWFPEHSILKWAEGIAGDLGLGFGWAAFYFTVFTAWWNGQAPGKRLFGIRVCKLDGSGLNLWESFGRYGGGMELDWQRDYWAFYKYSGIRIGRGSRIKLQKH